MTPPFDDKNTGIPYSELGNLYSLGDEAFEVITWTPAMAGRSAPGEQVHIMLHVGEDIHFLIRFKTRAAVDRFIQILEHHRDEASWE